LMDASDDRLEVADVERPRIEVAVPADDVEWMMVEDQLVDPVILLYQKSKVAHLVVRGQLERAPNVALGVRRTFLELAELVAVALGPPHVATTLHHKKLRLLALRIELV